MGLKRQRGKILTKDCLRLTLNLKQVEAETLDFTIGTEKDINKIKWPMDHRQNIDWDDTLGMSTHIS